MRRDLEPIELPPPHLDPSGRPPGDHEIDDLEDVGEQPIDDLDPGVADEEARRGPARPVRDEEGPIDDPNVTDVEGRDSPEEPPPA
jgi:hypothetical protein